ncbi:hypothetical protein KSP40_PGU014983 [Platanthera guangdongensis]|uniref:Peptidase S9A N-terminal domain-containing protein n=1 Tax=Platanthera guangdongensis TaxID=2320717 RepID=A0ABR2N1T3_9ASPA
MLLFRAFLCARHPLGLRFAHRRVAAAATSVKPNPSSPPPPSPPRPPQRPSPFSMHGITWQDPYSWMSNLSDSVSMRHMDAHMEQEEKYTEAVMASAGADRLQRKIQIEMAPRMASELCTPPIQWGPWLYYRRVQEGKPFPVLCRRKASLQEEFMSYNAPSAGFDYTSGKRIEQKLLDYNTEAERFGGYSYEESSEISPDHRFLAYTMYDKEKDSFTLSVRDLASGTLLERPRADRVANLCWAKNGQALLYTVTNNDKRPHRIFCSMLGSTKEDVLILEESDEMCMLTLEIPRTFSLFL